MEVVISFFAEPVIHVSPMTLTTARIFQELVKICKKLVEQTKEQISKEHVSKPTKRAHDESESHQESSTAESPSVECLEPLPPSNVSVRVDESMVSLLRSARGSLLQYDIY